MSFLGRALLKVAAVVPWLSDITQNVALVCHHLWMHVVPCQGLTLPGLQSGFMPCCAKLMSAKHGEESLNNSQLICQAHNQKDYSQQSQHSRRIIFIPVTARALTNTSSKNCQMTPILLSWRVISRRSECFRTSGEVVHSKLMAIPATKKKIKESEQRCQ